MSISEFKNSVNLIVNFVTRINQVNISPDLRKTLVKIYANSLKINLTDRMVDSIAERAAA